MLSLLFALFALHADGGCQLRARTPEVLPAMPNEVVGWVVCPSSGLNTLFVAHDTADFLVRYDRVMVEGGLALAPKSESEGVREYRSRRELDEVVHFVFKQDGLIFAYTDTLARAAKYRAQLMALKQTLSSAEWRRRLGAI